MGNPQAHSAFLKLNGLRFHYLSWGDERLPALVCLHGLRSYGRTFEPLALALEGRFRVIAPDQRGRGQTDWDPARNYYADQYLADLEAFVDALSLERFHLLGHSMGGISSILYAARHQSRVTSLVLEDSGPGASASSQGASRINAELANTPLRFPDRAAARAFWRSIRPAVTEEAIESRIENSMRERAGEIVWVHDQEGIAACRLRPDPARLAPDLWPGVKAIECPCLVVRGGNSDYLGTETLAAMSRTNPLIQTVEIAGAGHYVHDDQPEAFVAAVRAFLSTHATRR